MPGRHLAEDLLGRAAGRWAWRGEGPWGRASLNITILTREACHEDIQLAPMAAMFLLGRKAASGCRRSRRGHAYSWCLCWCRAQGADEGGCSERCFRVGTLKILNGRWRHKTKRRIDRGVRSRASTLAGKGLRRGDRGAGPIVAQNVIRQCAESQGGGVDILRRDRRSSSTMPLSVHGRRSTSRAGGKHLPSARGLRRCKISIGRSDIVM